MSKFNWVMQQVKACLKKAIKLLLISHLSTSESPVKIRPFQSLSGNDRQIKIKKKVYISLAYGTMYTYIY